jgi:hypothetical protein
VLGRYPYTRFKRGNIVNDYQLKNLAIKIITAMLEKKIYVTIISIRVILDLKFY